MTTEKESAKAINRMIGAIPAAYTKVNVMVQNTIVAIIGHCAQYGDCSAAARLVDAMPKSARRSAVIDHFGDYSPIRVVKDAKTGNMRANLRKPEDKLYRDYNLDGVRANNWFERASLDKEEEIVTVGVIKDLIWAAIKRAEKKAGTLTNEDDKGQALSFINKLKLAA